MSDITKSFQTLSKEVIATIKEFGEHGLTEAAQILEGIQKAEKEKLELTVQWQVLAQQERERGEGDSEEVDDFGAAEHQKKELRKKYRSTILVMCYHLFIFRPFLLSKILICRLAKTEGAIAELVQDLKYECESYLIPP